MIKKKSKSKTTKPKKKWVLPKLEVVSEVDYQKTIETKVYAQYGGGGGTVTHNPSGMYAESVYNDCM